MNVFSLFVKKAVELFVSGYQLHCPSSGKTFEQGIVNEMLQKRKHVAAFFHEHVYNHRLVRRTSWRGSTQEHAVLRRRGEVREGEPSLAAGSLHRFRGDLGPVADPSDCLVGGRGVLEVDEVRQYGVDAGGR